MRQSLSVFVVLGLFSILLLAPKAPTKVAYAQVTGSPPPTPTLQVQVNHTWLQDASGNKIHLHGVNMATSAYACLNGQTFNQPHDANLISVFQSHNINYVHLSLNEDCWLGINSEPASPLTATQYKSDILTWAESLEQAGIVVGLAEHWWAPDGYKSNNQETLQDHDHSGAFWASVAGTFATQKGVIFAGTEENTCYQAGSACGWPGWLNGGINVTCRSGGACPATYSFLVEGQNDMVKAIRGAETSWHHPIAAWTLGFSLSMSTWPSYAPSDTIVPAQIIAIFDSYTINGTGNECLWSDTACLASHVGAPVGAGYPVMMGECGNAPWSDSLNKVFLNWMQSNTSGGACWSWEPEGDAYDMTTDGRNALTTYGTAYVNWLQGL